MIAFRLTTLLAGKKKNRSNEINFPPQSLWLRLTHEIASRYDRKHPFEIKKTILGDSRITREQNLKMTKLFGSSCNNVSKRFSPTKGNLDPSINNNEGAEGSWNLEYLVPGRRKIDFILQAFTFLQAKEISLVLEKKKQSKLFGLK